MIRLANKQTTELWNHLRQGYESLVQSKVYQPTSSVSQVSPRYKTQVVLTDCVFRLRLLKNTVETNLDTDLVHEIMIYFDKVLNRVSFSSVSCNQKTGKRNNVSAEAYLPNIQGYVWVNILVDLVGNVATLKQVECLNLGVRFSDLGFDIVED